MIAIITALAFIGVCVLAEHYRQGRDDMAAWCLYVSRRVHEDGKTAEEILSGLKNVVIDKSEL